jgi:hypothetical protein
MPLATAACPSVLPRSLYIRRPIYKGDNGALVRSAPTPRIEINRSVSGNRPDPYACPRLGDGTGRCRRDLRPRRPFPPGPKRRRRHDPLKSPSQAANHPRSPRVAQEVSWTRRAPRRDPWIRRSSTSSQSTGVAIGGAATASCRKRGDVAGGHLSQLLGPRTGPDPPEMPPNGPSNGRV